MAKLETVKSITIITFTPSQNIPRHASLSKVLAVVPGGTELAKAQFSALMAALQEKDQVAIVRYVFRNGTSPKLGALVYMPKGYAYFVQLPYSQDVRYYRFPAFDFLTSESINSKSLQTSFTLPPTDRIAVESTTKHHLDKRNGTRAKAMEAIDGLIDSMDLDGMPDFWPKNTFNPSFQRIYQNILARVLDPSAALPEPEVAVRALLQPLSTFDEAAKPSLMAMQSCFTIEKVPEKAVKEKSTAREEAVLDDHDRSEFDLAHHTEAESEDKLSKKRKTEDFSSLDFLLE